MYIAHYVQKCFVTVHMQNICKYKYDVSVPPEGAKIVTPNSPLTAGREYAVSCRVWGSNPPARVEWFRGPRSQLRPVAAYNQSVSADGNVTVSWVRYAPEPGHHHQTLTCRYENPFHREHRRL